MSSETNNLFGRFAEMEVLVVLTLMVSTYKIEIIEKPHYTTRTVEQREERILKGNGTGLTLKASEVSLTFKRRYSST